MRILNIETRLFIVKNQLKSLATITEDMSDALTELIVVALKIKPEKASIPWFLFDVTADPHER